MNTTIEKPIVTEISKQPVVKQEFGDFGNGRYSPLMDECFTDAQRIFGLSEAKADKLSRQIASDFGAAISSAKIQKKHVGFGKTSEDGKVTVKEAGTRVKGVTMTNALFALVALKYAGEAGNNGFLFNSTKWAPVKQLTDYFDTL